MSGPVESEASESEERGGLVGPLLSLVAGGALLGLLFATVSFGLSIDDMQALLGVGVPVYGGLILYGLYGLLGRFLRSRAGRATTSGSGRGMMRVGLRHTPALAKAALAVFLVPMAIPAVRRAPTASAFARRASAFWIVPALVFAIGYGHDAMEARGKSADRNAIRRLVREATDAYPVDCDACKRAETLADRFVAEWGEEPGVGPERGSCHRMCD